MNTINPALLGFLRGLGFAVLFALLTFVGNAANLAPLVGESLAGILAALALAIEHSIASNTGHALFGAVRAPRG